MRRSIKKVAAGLLATMMIGTMLTGCGGLFYEIFILSV